MSDWICPICQTEIGSNFDACWNCGHEDKDKIKPKKLKIEEEVIFHVEDNEKHKKLKGLALRYKSLLYFKLFLWVLYIFSLLGNLYILTSGTRESFILGLLNILLTTIFIFSLTNIINFLFDLDRKTDKE